MSKQVYVGKFNDCFRGSGRQIILLISAESEDAAQTRLLKYMNNVPEEGESWEDLWAEVTMGTNLWFVELLLPEVDGIRLIHDEVIEG